METTLHTNSPARPRNPWPIVITVYFILFFVFVAAFTVFATRQKTDLVSADYYEQEARFQRQIDRLSRTLPLNAGFSVSYDTPRRLVLVKMPAAESSRPSAGRVLFYRPADSALDLQLPLSLNTAGVQEVDARALKAGLWKVRVEWTAQGEDYFFDQPVVVGAKSF